MPRTILYFDTPHALIEHDKIIALSGGLRGVKDEGAIDSILNHIQNDEYYPEFLDKLTHLVFSCIKVHAFNDGNKRTAIVLGGYFLTINGYVCRVKKFFRELENIAVWVAENKIDKDLLQDIIASILRDDDYPEDLKIRYLLAISK